MFGVTHTYAGYPMVRQAKALVAAGELGTIRVIQAEYAQSWLTETIETTGQKQAAWRTDPAQSGGGGCLGDIGTHAYHLAGYVSGLKAEAISAELTNIYVPRVPAGHPEGYLEAFGQLYADAAEQITAQWECRAASAISRFLPTVEDGEAGMKFIEAAIASSQQGGAWLSPR